MARQLIAAGIPVFAAPPCPAASGGTCSRPGHNGKEEYDLPPHWQKTVPSMVNLDRWQPGWALAAVGGHAADFLDEDPRSRGDEAIAELQQLGQMPRVYGVQATPSGGRHYLIAPLGERKATPLPGLDYQGGTPDGVGRGFVWIAPTVRRSKIDGVRHPYVWTQLPDTDWLAEGGDESGELLVARLRALRVKPERQNDDRVAREFTEVEAKSFCDITLQRLMQAEIGQIEEAANAAAAQLSHFVPDFWSEDFAFSVLMAALGETAYDPDHPASSWTADKFRPVLAGANNRAPNDWRAVRRPEVSGSAPEEQPTGRLRRAILKRSEIRNMPRPVALIDNVLYRSSVVVLAGKFGTYKSFVAVSWAASLATGKPWFGYVVPNRVPVIYAAAEGAYGIQMRLDAWESAHGQIPDDLYLIPISVRLNRAEDMRELEELIVETGAAALIFDTLHASTPGMDENDAGDAGEIFDVLRGLQERHGICAILPHHTGHAGERARGTSSIEDDADVSFVIKLDGEDRGPLTRRTLVHRKSKDQALLDDMDLHLQLVEGTGSGYVTTPDAWQAAAAVPPTGIDHGQVETIGEPQPWTRVLFDRENQETKRRILQVLADAAGQVGITESRCMALVAERWHGGRVGTRPGQLKKANFTRHWSELRAWILPDGELLVVNPSGERYAVNPDVITAEI